MIVPLSVLLPPEPKMLPERCCMVYLEKAEIIEKISRFYSQKSPFVFVLDSAGENGFVFSPEEASDNGIRYSLKGEKQINNHVDAGSFQFDIFPVEFEPYSLAFSKVMAHLKRGDTYLLNLTFETPVSCSLTLAGLYEISDAPFRMYVPGHFLVFSPEPFVRISGSEIFSHPMKGTIDASIEGARELLLGNRKELFEHNTIVDLIRNDLSMVSTGVNVDRFRYIEKICTNRGDLLQMSSEISGRLPEGFQKKVGEILFTLLPAGSVTGAPKKKTVEIIKAAETHHRGFYTGVFGYFDGVELVTAVTIRYIEQRDGNLFFKSGGGITAMSDPVQEYNEMIQKIYVPVA
jgi:para-aminobenzoate synthetase component 1